MIFWILNSRTYGSLSELFEILLTLWSSQQKSIRLKRGSSTRNDSYSQSRSYMRITSSETPSLLKRTDVYNSKKQHFPSPGIQHTFMTCRRWHQKREDYPLLADIWGFVHESSRLFSVSYRICIRSPLFSMLFQQITGSGASKWFENVSPAIETSISRVSDKRLFYRKCECRVQQHAET